MTKTLLQIPTLITLVLLGACTPREEPGRFTTIPGGVSVKPSDGTAKVVRLEVLSPKVIRVTAFPTESTELPQSLMAVRQADANVPFEAKEENGAVIVKTADVSAEVSIDSGAVSFKDKAGRNLLTENVRGREFSRVDVQGKAFYSIRQEFESPSSEAFYGLGQHQNGQMNHKGDNVELAQHNMDIAMPFVVSSRNYGLLWDNTSITRFGDPRPWQPIAETLKLRDADGKEGGLTAQYSVAGKVVLTRVENDISYQYIKSLAGLPSEIGKSQAQRITWAGTLEAQTGGLHKFSLYASDYHKLYIDDQLVLDAWRQNWNPWYRDFELQMEPGAPKKIRIEWDRTSGYLALFHRDPLPAAQQNALSLFSEVGHAIDYYFIHGQNADDVIAGYRFVTGKATLPPKWVYGFWQSRERYKTQDELLGVLREYRKRRIPLDNIVQDWHYWREDSWGSHQFDPERFPDPRAMMDQVHAQNAQLMLSMWPKFYPTTEHYKELDAKGFIYRRNVEQKQKDWVGMGYLSSFYDPYSAEARQIYWRQIHETLGKLRIDAWWLDSVEPDMQSNLDIEERKLRMGPTAMGPGAQYFNSYPLVNAQGVYEGARAATPDKRVFIFTRSAFPGLQRYAAGVWSGDVASRWSDLHEQISAGLNMSMSGLPNWSFDIGGFSVEPRYEKPDAKALREWRELNTRWFQFGAFVPLFRSHGQFPLREIYNIAPAGTEVYDTLVYYTKLRYRLLPYIYTAAANTYHNDYTIMRGLIMDFPSDQQVRDIGDQYMFGPAFLVCPVYEYGAMSREVYLPEGTHWYDFYSGERTDGGKRIKVAAPLTRMPLFVRAGSIVPIGPEIQYSSEKPDAPLTLFVYTGKDGTFTLYEDSGTDNGYEKGEFSTIPFAYDDQRGELKIGNRSGRFPGLVEKRTFNVRWIAPGEARAADFDVRSDESVEYSGGEITVVRKQ
jgi:alpha-D-xyloside xylohydrolase